MKLLSQFRLSTDNGAISKKPCFDLWVDGFTVLSRHAKTTCSPPDSANFQGRSPRQCTILVGVLSDKRSWGKNVYGILAIFQLFYDPNSIW